jgi:hypothetical protein
MRCDDDDDDDDMQCVRALRVPMHISLIDRPFVPHNLTPDQERPVPIPNGPLVERDTRLQGIFKYLCLFISKALRKERPSMFLQGALHRGPPPWASLERDAPFLEPPFCQSFRIPRKGPLPPCSLHRAPTERERDRERERDAPPPEPLPTISQSLREMSPLQAARLSPHKERCPSQELSFHNIQGP